MSIFDFISSSPNNARTKTHRYVPGAKTVPDNGIPPAALKKLEFSLGKIGEALRFKKYPTVQSRMESFLRQVGTEGNLDSLLLCLKHGDTTVRSGAAWVLGRRNDPKAVEPLTPLLKDEREDVRRAAEEAIAKLKNK